MNLITVLFICVNLLLMQVGAQESPQSNDVLTRRLYDSVVIGDYDDAVAITHEIVKNGNAWIISNVVYGLVNISNGHSLAYAYKLWRDDGKDIVKLYFPIQFRLLVNEHEVKLINKRDNLAVKLGWATDDINDRQAYGDGRDKLSDRISWKFLPFWESNRLYFKILNLKHNQYLKLEVASDDVGEHKAWGDDKADTYRHQWYLQPVKLDNDILFFIYNRDSNQALKLGRAVDGDGDRVVWGHNGVVEGNPQHFGWFIQPF